MNEGSDSDHSDSHSSAEEDDEGDESMPRRRGRPPRGASRDDADYVKGFTTAEVRRFVRSFRKFGDPLNRFFTDQIFIDFEFFLMFCLKRNQTKQQNKFFGKT